MHSSLSLPEESDRTGCTLPSVRSFLWIHAGDAGSQDAQLGQREGDGSRTCGERERCSGCNQNREGFEKLWVNGKNTNLAKHNY